MTDYFYELSLQEHFRELTARDRQLERCGWFRRNEHRPRKSGWRFRTGEALIRLGCRLQGRGDIQPARMSGEL